MERTLLKSKIHRATVTDADLHYEGSITIDRDLMDAADLVEYEKVAILDINNGQRFETYVIEGPRGKGDICLNGAAARLVQKGDLVIIVSYCNLKQEDIAKHNPTVVFVDENNKQKQLHGAGLHAV
jgi:aspartate 1-decarboxylase